MATSMGLQRRQVSYKDICWVLMEGILRMMMDSSWRRTARRVRCIQMKMTLRVMIASRSLLTPYNQFCVCREQRSPGEPWKKAVIVKLLGKKVGMKFLRTRL